MAVYSNLTQTSSLKAVEFTPVADGNFTFFYVDPAQKNEIKTWLTQPEIGQTIVAETQANGRAVLVTQGNKSKNEMIKALEARGDHITFSHKPAKFSIWKASGAMGLAGQGMQFASSLMRRKLDVGLFMFAVLNISANLIGIVFGAEKSEDVNRLHYLKDNINDKLDEHLPDGTTLPSVYDKRANRYTEPEAPKSVPQKAYEYIQRHSVRIGEIGLRYMGAIALAFPINRWGMAFSKLRKGNITDAYLAGRDPSTLRHLAGIGSLLGKNIALFSKTEDPFDPKPKTWLDTMREKYVFRLGGTIESAAFATLGYDGFKNGKITYGGKQHADFLSGTGGMIFSARYMLRNWAPFGIRNVDTKELYAHVTDSLAMMPPEKIPQLLADTTAGLQEHFKDQPIDFGKVFTQLRTDLYRYHGISLNSNGQAAVTNAAAAKLPAVSAPETGTTTFASANPPPRRMADRITPPLASHAEGAAKAAVTTQVGI